MLVTRAQVRASLALACLSAACGAQAAVFTVNTLVGGVVNGQALVSSGVGSADSSTGVYTIDWTLTSVPVGYSVWGTIYSKPGSLGAAVAREVGGAFNLLTLCGGNYSIHEVGTFSSGGTITADVTIATVGDQITVNATLSGNVNLPNLVGLTAPAHVWTPGPGPGQFVETVVKQLIREDGGPPIQLETAATYTLAGGASLPVQQLRDLSMTVVSSLPSISNPATATIRYESVVRPIPAPGSVVLLGGLWLALRRRPRAAS